MIYQEFKPSEQLKNIVDSYWFFSSLDQLVNENILPDGCMDLIFNFGALTNSIPSNEVGVTGMMTTYSNQSFERNTELLGIRFKSGMLSKISSFPLFEIKDMVTEASIIIPEFNIEVVEKLKEQNSIDKKLKLIEKALLKIVNSRNTSSDNLIPSVIELIQNSSASITVENIAKHHCISLRQLERKFKYQVGVTAKEYERIIRFQKTKKLIKTETNRCLLDIALYAGYFDHSHLSNEFKRLSGKNPSEFR